MSFSKGFLWGAASAAFQIEGAHDADGKVPGIGDALTDGHILYHQNGYGIMDGIYLNLGGAADRAARFLQRESLMDRAQWTKFVDVFRTQPDGENYGWRGGILGEIHAGRGAGVQLYKG